MRIAILPLAAMILIGCGHSRESDLVGNWKKSTKLPASFKAKPEWAKIQADWENSTYNFTADHKCSYHMGDKLNATGTWSMQGDIVTAHTTQVDGTPVETMIANVQKSKLMREKPEQAKKFITDLQKDDHLKLSADGKTLENADPPEAGDPPIAYAKL